MSSTVSEKLVNRLAGAFTARPIERRGFLGTVALVATALVVDPLGYITRPASALATVCGSGSACGAGWSAFCCTINNGANTCPPKSFVGGWWKADHSSYCGGGARYYIDCNAYAGDRTYTCHCASGTCDQRRVACNQFRYGQCNQQIGPYGPVVCRVVSCRPPWEYDSTCRTTSATDNATADHNAPCLAAGTAASKIQEDEEEMFKLVRNNQNGGVWLVAPGYERHLDLGEYIILLNLGYVPLNLDQGPFDVYMSVLTTGVVTK